MADPEDVAELTGDLVPAVALLVRRLRQITVEDGELTMPQRSALARLDRGGPATASALARAEQISPQSMGATLAELQSRGLIERRRDPDDGRQLVLHVSDAGRGLLQSRRSARTERIARVLESEFTDEEVTVLRSAAPLLERLAGEL